MQKFLNTSLQVVLLIFIALFPSFFLTSYTNTFDFPKLILIIAATILLVVVFSLKLVIEGKFTIATSKADLAIFFLTIAYVASGILRTPNKIEAFVIPGTAGIVVGGLLIYLLTKLIFRSEKERVAQSLLASGVILSIFSIFAYLGIFGSIPQLPEIMKRPEFSPLGGKLPELIFLGVLLPIGVTLAWEIKDSVKKVFYSFATLIIFIAFGLALTQMLPGKPAKPVIVDHQTSWEVAVDSLKVSPILGIGPGNYLTAFSRFLPLTYNSTPLWSNRFLSGSSYLMTMVTETGLLGFASFVVLLWVLFKSPLSNLKKTFAKADKTHVGYFVSILLLTLSLLLLPAATALIILFFLLVYLNSDTNETTINLSATSLRGGSVFISKMPSAFLAVVLLALSLVLGLFTAKVAMAEQIYKKGVEAILANDAKTAYNSLRDAIAQNGYVDRYHATNAQLNLALARSLSQKTEITDADRQAIAQLIQQAIAEGKATVALNPQRSANWETLARTYQAIMPFAQGADNFTVISMNQAVALDPINPNLRIALGGVYYALGKYDDAINAFTLAVTAKQDLANAHYNLAIAYREKKDFDKAIAEMNTVLTLVKKDSQDYTVAQKTLDELKKAKPQDPEASENLTPPQTAQEQVLDPLLELPNEATPPAQP